MLLGGPLKKLNKNVLVVAMVSGYEIKVDPRGGWTEATLDLQSMAFNGQGVKLSVTKEIAYEVAEAMHDGDNVEVTLTMRRIHRKSHK